MSEIHRAVGWLNDPSPVVGKRIFSGFVDVRRVVNGYVVSIASGEGRLADMHIAQNITQVNEILATAMVAFQLENP